MAAGSSKSFGTLWAGTLGMVIFFSSGCRFGNYSSPTPPAPNTVYEYGTAPLSFATVVIYTTLNTDGTHQLSVNSNTPLVGIPPSVSATFSNPVALVVPTDKTLSPYFFNLANQYSLTTTLTDSTTIQDSAVGTVTPLWQNTSCLTSLQITQSGTIHPQTTESYVDANGNSQTTNGRLSLSLTVIRTIQGDCQTDLQALASCYQNNSTCDSNTYNAAYTLFDTWVHYGQVLTLDSATLAKIYGLAYILNFE